MMDGRSIIPLGSMATDRITGFTGMVTARAEYLNGCVAYRIEPTKLKKDGGIQECEWFDEGRLTEDKEAAERPGGPQSRPPTAAP